MPTIITPNPWKDPIASLEISAMNAKLYSELRQYKGDKLPDGNALKQTEKRLKDIFYTSLLKIGRHSLVTGCSEVGIAVPSNLELEMYSVCRDRASFSAESMVKTTAVAFGVVYAALSKKNAVGKNRSKSAADYEGSKIFFEQRTKAWRLKHGVMKSWYCADDPCNICQDNEDDGPIPLTEDFSSGDTAPPIHLNCECLMSLVL
jgi:hypothetical protein